MKNIAPEITRQRLLIEGYYPIDVDEAVIKSFFQGIADELDLRTYGEPIIFSPDSGMGRGENMGYDAFVPLIDSGISLYIWSQARFFSAIIYTCKAFDDQKAVDFTRRFFQVTGELAYSSF